MRRIKLRKLGQPLATLRVGRASSAIIEIENLPDYASAIQLHFGNPTDASTAAVDAHFAPGGIARCYVNGAFFPTVGTAKYHITAPDGDGGSFYLGVGRLVIMPSVLQDVSPSAAVGLPDDTYLRGTDGLYYKLSVSIDEETGTPVVDLAEEGIEK